MSTDAPFVLISTDELRAKEREIWDSYPDDISRPWRSEYENTREYNEKLKIAQAKELAQVKPHNTLHSKQANLFYPATLDEIKKGLD